MKRAIAIALLLATVAACQSLYEPSPGPLPPPAPPSEPQPQAPPPEAKAPEPPPPAQPSRKTFRLSAASSALVTQAHGLSKSGNTSAAAATIERALRIEPANPLLWIELGRVRLEEKNPAQADTLGRKALALASGDRNTQAAAWRLIAESLRARGRADEASKAEGRAKALLTTPMALQSDLESESAAPWNLQLTDIAI